MPHCGVILYPKNQTESSVCREKLLENLTKNVKCNQPDV